MTLMNMKQQLQQAILGVIDDERHLGGVYKRVFDDAYRPIAVDLIETLGRVRVTPDHPETATRLNAWYAGFERTKRCVCKLKVGDRQGTGFLVAPNVVLTNYHMVYLLIEQQMPGTGITVWFDYKSSSSPNDATGEAHKLDDDWWIAYGKTSAVDELPEDAKRPPKPDDLDYVLLRLRDAPGDDRGCIPVPISEPDIRPGSPLCMLQHPADQSFQFAFSPHGVHHFNGDRTRLCHRLSAYGGASGSPIFDKDWTLVALHRGPMALPPRGKIELNSAIPIARIRDHFLHNPGINPRARAEVGWG